MRKTYYILTLLGLSLLSGCGSTNTLVTVEKTVEEVESNEFFSDDEVLLDSEELEKDISYPVQEDVKEVVPFSGSLIIDGLELKFGETTWAEIKQLGDYELDDDGLDETDLDPVIYVLKKSRSNWLTVRMSDSSDNAVLMDFSLDSCDSFDDNWYQLDGLPKNPSISDLFVYFGEDCIVDDSESLTYYYFTYDNFEVKARYDKTYEDISLDVYPILNPIQFGINESSDFNGFNVKLGETSYNDLKSLSYVGILPEKCPSDGYRINYTFEAFIYPDYLDSYNSIYVQFGYNSDISDYYIRRIKFDYENLDYDYCERPLYELSVLPCGSTIDDAKSYYIDTLGLSLAKDVWVDYEDVITWYDDVNSTYISVKYDLDSNKILYIDYELK